MESSETRHSGCQEDYSFCRIQGYGLMLIRQGVHMPCALKAEKSVYAFPGHALSR